MNRLKTCPACGRTLPLEAFSRHRRRRDGLQPWCIDCNRAQKRTWSATALGRRKAFATALWQTYRMTLADWDRLLLRQVGQCDSCGAPFGPQRNVMPAVDHCHRRDAVRALIHQGCNSSIGHMGERRLPPAELARRLRCAGDYVEWHEARIERLLGGEAADAS